MKPVMAVTANLNAFRHNDYVILGETKEHACPNEAQDTHNKTISESG